MSAKSDMMKKIAEKALRKKQLSKEVSREKTVAFLVTDFFKDTESVDGLVCFALAKLTDSLKKIDRDVTVAYFDPTDGDHAVEIRWSQNYIDRTGCEAVSRLDATTAFFQSMVDEA